MDTWVLTDGRMFQAELVQAMPGQLKVRLADGREEVVEIVKLSALSKKRAAERLGLGAEAVVGSVSGPPATEKPISVTEAPSSSSTGGAKMPAPTVEGAVEVTDKVSIESAMGMEITVVGRVQKVATLGSAGHKKISFEGSPVVAFIGKWNLEKSGDWEFDGLEGKSLQVTGKVDKYNDELQVQPTSPNGMKVLEAE